MDVGGRRLHVICIGDGDPTVVFEPSMFGGATSSEAARRELSARTRVCSYDRMGMGWSDPGPSVISTSALTDDLERLLEQLGIPGPLVLVPSSVGGLTSELFARRHPDRVAGLVYLDAAQSLALEDLERRFGRATRLAATAAACLPKAAARVGLLRLIDPLGLRRERDAAQKMAAMYRVDPMATGCGMVRAFDASLSQLRAAPPLRSDVPLIVLTAETTDKLAPLGVDSVVPRTVEDRIRLQQQFARMSTQGSWRLVPGSDHLIGNSQPHAVASAVLEIVDRARSGDAQRRQPR